MTTMVTMKEVCKTIVEADFLRLPDGSAPSAEEIYNSSPTGELFHVFDWYEQAKLIINERSNSKIQGAPQESPRILLPVRI